MNLDEICIIEDKSTVGNKRCTNKNHLLLSFLKKSVVRNSVSIKEWSIFYETVVIFKFAMKN